MRHAPPVSVQCRGRGWRVLQSAVAASSAAVCAAWLVQHVSAGRLAGLQSGPLPGDISMAAVVALATAGLAWRRLHVPPVRLGWDGQAWSVDTQPVALQLAMDLGQAVLVRWRPGTGGRWHWTAVSPRDAGAAWHALRMALHAHGTRPHDTGAAWR